MNYKVIYDNLITQACSEDRRKDKNRPGFYEQHHIIPKCLRGSDDKNNLVLLTTREHFIAHKLLIEIYPNNKKLAIPLLFMCSLQNNIRSKPIISSREFERIKLQMGSAMSSLNKGIIKKKRDHFSWSKEARDRRRLFYKNNPEIMSGENNPMYGKNRLPGYSHSEETKKKMRRSRSEETRKKMQKSKSQKHRENMSLSNAIRFKEKREQRIIELLTRKTELYCPYCSVSGTTKRMFNYHFDNCKFKSP